AAVRPDFGSKFGNLDAREQVTACVNLAKRAGLDFLVLDQPRPDIEVPVARVIVPGLRHFYRRFAPGRLYDVPVKLGWRDRPLSESELNPLHPQTGGSFQLARSPNKARTRGCAGNSIRPGSVVTSPPSAFGRRNRRLLRCPSGRLGKVQRGRGGSRAG